METELGILLSSLRLSDETPSVGAESLRGGLPGLDGIVPGIVSHSGLLNVPLVHLFASFAMTGKEVFIEEFDPFAQNLDFFGFQADFFLVGQNCHFHTTQTLMAMRAVEGVVVGLIFLPRADVVESCLAFFASLPEEAAVEAFKLRSVYHQWYSFALRHPSLFWQRLEVVKYISETVSGVELDNGLRQTREGSYEKGPWPDAVSMAIDPTAYHMSFIDLYCMGLHGAMVSGGAPGTKSNYGAFAGRATVTLSCNSSGPMTSPPASTDCAPNT